MNKSRNNVWAKYSTTVAFLVLTAVTILGFMRVEALDREVEKESIQRALVLCERDNDVRELLSTTLRSLFQSSDQTFNEELAAIEERLTALESTVLAPTDCDQVAEQRADDS